jgi:hypothetical protein
MANEIPFEKILSNKSTCSPPIRSSSLTSFKQYRQKDTNQNSSEYQWISRTDEKRLILQKNLEERQKVCIEKYLLNSKTYFEYFF